MTDVVEESKTKKALLERLLFTFPLQDFKEDPSGFLKQFEECKKAGDISKLTSEDWRVFENITQRRQGYMLAQEQIYWMQQEIQTDAGKERQRQVLADLATLYHKWNPEWYTNTEILIDLYKTFCLLPQ